jgi:hypothetical protein
MKAKGELNSRRRVNSDVRCFNSYTHLTHDSSKEITQMKSTITFLILFSLVAFMSQCGAKPTAISQPQSATPSATAPQSQGVTKTAIAFGNFHYTAANGRGWNQLANGSKEIFIEGMISGIVAALQRSSQKLDSTSTETLSWLMSAGEKHSKPDVIQQIDKFYSDSANVNIPVLEAYKYTFFKFEGATEEDLNKAVSKLRSQYK